MPDTIWKWCLKTNERKSRDRDTSSPLFNHSNELVTIRASLENNQFWYRPGLTNVYFCLILIHKHLLISKSVSVLLTNLSGSQQQFIQLQSSLLSWSACHCRFSLFFAHFQKINTVNLKVFVLVLGLSWSLFLFPVIMLFTVFFISARLLTFLAEKLLFSNCLGRAVRDLYLWS